MSIDEDGARPGRAAVLLYGADVDVVARAQILEGTLERDVAPPLTGDEPKGGRQMLFQRKDNQAQSRKEGVI